MGSHLADFETPQSHSSCSLIAPTHTQPLQSITLIFPNCTHTRFLKLHGLQKCSQPHPPTAQQYSAPQAVDVNKPDAAFPINPGQNDEDTKKSVSAMTLPNTPPFQHACGCTLSLTPKCKSSNQRSQQGGGGCGLLCWRSAHHALQSIIAGMSEIRLHAARSHISAATVPRLTREPLLCVIQRRDFLCDG
jgi:hypothetical protein